MNGTLAQALAAELVPLTRFATALCGNRVHAEGLVAAAMEQVLPRTDVRSIPAYLRRSVVNLHLNDCRSAARRQNYLRGMAPLNQQAETPADLAQVRVDMDRALARLKPLERAVVVLRYFEGCSAEEAAEILHRPAGTIRRLTHQALATLRAAPELRRADTFSDEQQGDE